MITQAQAQAQHEQRQRNESGHDDISCWCCCLTCCFDTATISDFPHESDAIDAATLARLEESERAIADGDTVDAAELARLMAERRGTPA